MAPILRRLFPPSQAPTTGVLRTAEHDNGIVTPETFTKAENKVPADVIDQEAASEESQVPNEHAQDGVTQAEAITLTWTKTSLGFAYIL